MITFKFARAYDNNIYVPHHFYRPANLERNECMRSIIWVASILCESHFYFVRVGRLCSEQYRIVSLKDPRSTCTSVSVFVVLADRKRREVYQKWLQIISAASNTKLNVILCFQVSYFCFYFFSFRIPTVEHDFAWKSCLAFIAESPSCPTLKEVDTKQGFTCFTDGKSAIL